MEYVVLLCLLLHAQGMLVFSRQATDLLPQAGRCLEELASRRRRSSSIAARVSIRLRRILSWSSFLW
jgi:hypothetical protein